MIFHKFIAYFYAFFIKLLSFILEQKKAVENGFFYSYLSYSSSLLSSIFGKKSAREDVAPSTGGIS